jgi:hypothetical protein
MQRSWLISDIPIETVIATDPDAGLNKVKHNHRLPRDAWPFSDFSYEAKKQKAARYLLGVGSHAALSRQRIAASAV